MAVNYETGVATDPIDLLAKLRTFSGANGWTWTNVAGGGWVVNNSAADVFCGIQSDSDEWLTRGCLGLNSLVAYDAQTNNAGETHSMNLGAGPFIAYHFYVGDEGGREYIHVAVEITAGLFHHWSLAELIKSGAYTGGVASESTRHSTSSLSMNDAESTSHRVVGDANNHTNANTHVWVDYDGKSNNWQFRDGNGDDEDGWIGNVRGEGLHAALRNVGPLDYNLRTPVWPVMYFVGRADALRSPIGRQPHMRIINVRNFDPGELLTIGSDVWQVFPIFAKYLSAPADGIVSSGLHGYAYLR